MEFLALLFSERSCPLVEVLGEITQVHLCHVILSRHFRGFSPHSASASLITKLLRSICPSAALICAQASLRSRYVGANQAAGSVTSCSRILRRRKPNVELAVLLCEFHFETKLLGSNYDRRTSPWITELQPDPGAAVSTSRSNGS